MLFNKSGIHNILVISLTNIGDVILTLPVVDILKNDFPAAKLSVVVSPKAASLLEGNPHLEKVYIFDKQQSVYQTILWICELRRQHFDLVIDLRHTAIPFFISAKYKTPVIRANRGDAHMRDKHLLRLRSVYLYDAVPEAGCVLFVSDENRRYARGLVQERLDEHQRYVVVAPGAADQAKRWAGKYFTEVCYNLIKKYYVKVVFVGDESDRRIAQRIVEMLGEGTLNLCGQTNLIQLAEVLRHALLVIANDSAPMHLASYLDVPVLALFGPTDALKYGPWSSNSRYLRQNQFCPACQNPRSSSRHTCMEAITTSAVLEAFQVIDNQVIFSKS